MTEDCADSSIPQNPFTNFLKAETWIAKVPKGFESNDKPGRPVALNEQVAAEILASIVAVGDTRRGFCMYLSPDSCVFR